MTAQGSERSDPRGTESSILTESMRSYPILLHCTKSQSSAADRGAAGQGGRLQHLIVESGRLLGRVSRNHSFVNTGLFIDQFTSCPSIQHVPSELPSSSRWHSPHNLRGSRTAVSPSPYSRRERRSPMPPSSKLGKSIPYLSILNGDQRRQGGNVGVVVNERITEGNRKSKLTFRRDIPWACALTAGIIIGRRASSPDHHLDVEGTHPFFDVSVGNSFGHVRLPRAVELTEALLPVAVAVTDGRQDYSIPGARVLPDVIARRAGVVGLVAYSAVKKLLHVKRSTTQAVCPHFLASLARSLIGRGHFRARGGFERARKVDHAEMIHLGSSEGPEDDLVRAVVDEIDLYGHLFIDFHGIALLK
eukprot:757285-Hanusia_phi.AAC.1